MKQKLRVAYASCSEDNWVSPIAGDFEKISNNLNFEFFFIGRGSNNFINYKKYIDLNTIPLKKNLNSSTKSIENQINNFTFHVDLSLKIHSIKKANNIITKETIRKNLRKWYEQAIYIYKIIQPDLLIIWSGAKGVRAMFKEAAYSLNIPILYTEKGVLPNSWYLDPLGTGPNSSFAKIYNNFQVSTNQIKIFEKKIEEINLTGASAWGQPARNDISKMREKLNIKSSQKVIFFPAQVDDDVNIILYSKHFKNTLKALEWLSKDLPENEFFILTKLHPKGRLTENDLQSTLKNKGAVLNLNILDAIELSDCVVTINSTAAFEASMRAKPVLLLGQSILSGKKFVSNYTHEKSAKMLIIDCIEKYHKNKNAHYLDALTFGAFLDLKYYTYKNDIQKTQNLLSHYLDDLTPFFEKRYSEAELIKIFKNLKLRALIILVIKTIFKKIKSFLKMNC